MTDHPPDADPAPDAEPTPEERPHWLQRLMDNPWLLLVLGLAVPLLSYTLWGWIELASLPDAPLP